MGLYLVLFLFALILAVVTTFCLQRVKIKFRIRLGKSNDTKDNQDAPKA